MGEEEKTVTMVTTTKSTAQGTIIKILNKLLPEDVQSNDLNLSQLQSNNDMSYVYTLSIGCLLATCRYGWLEWALVAW